MNEKTKQLGVSAIIFICFISGLMIVHLIWLWIYKLINPNPDFKIPPTEEILMGIIVVGALVALLLLLTFMASTYKRLNLSNKNQALGLPDGSVRAMIALFLLLAFVILNVYLFRAISNPNYQKISGLNEDEVRRIDPSIIVQKQQENDGTYDIWIRLNNEASDQFANQLSTAMITLVTAVSSFYFASKIDAGKKDTGKIETRAKGLIVIGIRPNSGAIANGEITITNLSGMGFNSNTQVRLRLDGQSDIEAYEVEAIDETRIICKFDLTGSTPGKWDIIVQNPDGQDAKLAGGFEIT